MKYGAGCFTGMIILRTCFLGEDNITVIDARSCTYSAYSDCIYVHFPDQGGTLHLN